MQTSQFSFTRLSILIFLFLIGSGCGPLGPSFPPANVEVIVPENEGVSSWLLSPEGDKIAYRSGVDNTSTIFLLFPATQQKYNLGRCSIFIWLNNATLYCLSEASIIVSRDADNVVTVPLKVVKASEVDLARLLKEAGTIYRFESENNILLLRDGVDWLKPNKNYLVEGVENIDAVLQGHTAITIPGAQPVGFPEEQVYSPDGRYYYNLNINQYGLIIYDATKDSKVTEFIQENLESIILGGWAANSSGVYFEVVSNARIGLFPNHYLNQILKLKVQE